MLSKSRVSLLKSLQQKKFRREHGFFLVEGDKSIAEFVGSPYHIEAVYYAPAFDPKVLKLSQKINLCEISVTELEKISSLKTPQDAIAQIRIPEWPILDHNELKGQFSLALDGIQDPGNMGTIIRIADWFGISNIICSEDTVDAYNPKVVQACMGSLARVKVHYAGLNDLLSELKLPVFGALLDGSNIYQTDFGSEGLILMGNEGNGIRPEIQPMITKTITIPRIGKAESLNVAIATAIFCSEISRKRWQGV
ncbi:MAG TPA: RNA methyltransferase [Mucilaginibacter sp.]|jgi:TrmH family RNA methyltransferase|nr:RNA methyltransferase [Mucilaginibacter sp.]